jgi:murein DD-endopeptidase MepM/ murein hydrolase activator NlpD
VTSPRAPKHRTAARRFVAVALVAVLGMTTIGPAAPVGADHGTEAAKQAAREIQAARDRANAAAQAVFDAESAIDTFTIEIAQAEKDLAAVEAQSSAMRVSLEESAIRRFTQSGGSDFILLGNFDDANNDLTAEVLAAVTQDTATVELDDFDEVIKEVDAARKNLEQQRADADAAQKNYAELKRVAEQEIVRLGEVEEQRQIDDAIEHELQRQREERARQAAAAAAAQAAQDQAAADQRAAQQRAAASAAGTNSSSNNSGGSSNNNNSNNSNSTPAAAPAPAPAPAPTPTRNGMVCPIRGNYAFANTWGAPRSGGRSHQGVDMIAPSGTSLVAAESGTVRYSSNRLGGNAAWVTGNSGTKYYYAHLRGFTGGNRSVSQGEQIGTVGQTGNAGTPHLHLQIHPGGGRAVNPYPYVASVC